MAAAVLCVLLLASAMLFKKYRERKAHAASLHRQSSALERAHEKLARPATPATPAQTASQPQPSPPAYDDDDDDVIGRTPGAKEALDGTAGAREMGGAGYSARRDYPAEKVDGRVRMRFDEGDGYRY